MTNERSSQIQSNSVNKQLNELEERIRTTNKNKANTTNQIQPMVTEDGQNQ
jgi:hypothetical protein